MTDLLEQAIAAVRGLDASEQDRIAEAMLSFAGQNEPEEIDPDHVEDVLRGLAETSRGEFATDKEVAAVFARFDR